MRRRISALISAIAALALLGPGPGGVGASMAAAQQVESSAAWQPEADDQWLFELRTNRLRIGDGIRGYANGANVCVNLADVIMALDLPIRVDTQLRRATGWALDERHTLVIDRDAGQVVVASRVLPLTTNAIVDTPAGWCVDRQFGVAP
jgi:hypothetical protein